MRSNDYPSCLLPTHHLDVQYSPYAFIQSFLLPWRWTQTFSRMLPRSTTILMSTPWGGTLTQSPHFTSPMMVPTYPPVRLFISRNALFYYSYMTIYSMASQFYNLSLDQSSVSVAQLHQIRILVSLMLLVAVCADGAVRVFRIDDTSSKSFK